MELEGMGGIAAGLGTGVTRKPAETSDARAIHESTAASDTNAGSESPGTPIVSRWVRVSVATAGHESTRTHRNEAQREEPGRTVLTFAASTETEDRAGDVVVASGWNLEAFRQNPVFLWAHRHDEPPIGKVLETWVEGKSLMARVEFAPTPFAQEVASLYKGGYLSGVSVGFRALEIERRRASNGRTATRFLRQELLELSAAPVPLNAEALLARSPDPHLGHSQRHPEALEGRALTGLADPAAGAQHAVPDGWAGALEDIWRGLREAL